MRSWASLVVTLLAVALCHSCAVKSYPRSVNALEEYATTAAHTVDIVAGKVAPKEKTGRKYDLTRQTPFIEYSFYMDDRFKGNPKAFYPAPKTVPLVQIVDKFKDNKKREIMLMKWKSQYRPQNPDFALYYETYVENQDAWAIFARSKKKNQGAIIVCHKWTGTDLRRVWRRGNYDKYLKKGYDVLLLQQPYHGFRSLEGSVFSGEKNLSGEVASVNEAMCQAVTDIRSMVSWLKKKREYEVVGVLGYSLGGTAALQAAVVDKNIDFVVAWKPPTSLGDVSQESPLAPFAVQAMRMSDLDQEAVKRILYVSGPANFNPSVSPDDVIVFAGMGDTFVPPEQPLFLINRWGVSKVVWYAGGHYLNMQKPLCKREERKFLDRRLPGYEEPPEFSWDKLFKKDKDKNKDVKDQDKDGAKEEKKSKKKKKWWDARTWKKDKPKDGK